MSKKQTLTSGFRDVFWMGAWGINFLLAWHFAAGWLGLPKPSALTHPIDKKESLENGTEDTRLWEENPTPEPSPEPSEKQPPQREVQRGP